MAARTLLTGSVSASIFDSFMILCDKALGVVRIIDGKGVVVADVTVIFWRRMRTQIEWKVPAQMSLAAGPSIVSRRCLNSPAALLVKVMQRMFHGRAGETAVARRNSVSSSFVPLSSSASIAGTYFSAPAGTNASSYALPKWIRCAMRLTSTVVLPLPAPARTSSGPLTAYTASRCFGLRNAYSLSKSARFLSV